MNTRQPRPAPGWQRTFAVIMLVLATFALAPLYAADAEDKKAEEKANEKEKEKEKEKSFAETISKLDKLEGLFTLYRDPKNGELLMEVRADQMDREYVYFNYTENGVVAAGHFRGMYRGQAIFRLQKYFDRIEFVEQNTGFYFDPENPLARAETANISSAVLASNKIVATSKAGDRYLIKLDDVLLTEALQKISPNSDPDKKPHEQFSLGKLSKDKTRYADVRVYPENINVRVDYVYDNDSPYVRGGDEVTDPRAVTLTVQHSFVAMPDDGYTQRMDDARIGYFLSQVTDLTSHKITPYRDLINRWRLVKKNPEQAISEPVRPIVWWIENTTPYAYRDAIREGVLSWNEAFEQAGFRNAIVVKEQPDNADWDAGDIRYNVLRWTSSPNPPFGGYGPSFKNPRTGEIMGADIMLEDIYVSNRVRVDRIFERYGMEQQRVAASDFLDAGSGYCAISAGIAHGLMLAQSTMKAMGDTSKLAVLVEQSLHELALHEVGHTLGLNHNMRASQLRSNTEIHDAALTQGVLIGSVMDYAPVNLAPPGTAQGQFFTVRPGPYDVWAIQFGYDPDMEGEKRVAHLARSSEPALAFGNDADDMRSPGKAIDPRVNVDDMSSDAIVYAQGRFDLIDASFQSLQEKLTTPGESWAEIRNAFLVLTSEQLRQARAVSRFVGGVYVDRAVAGSERTDASPYQPVPEARQRLAMSVLGDRVFGTEAFKVPSDLIRHLGMQRRGFEHMGDTEDPKIHTRALKIQADVLDHLMHPVVLTRITDTTLYGNPYNVSAVLADLTSAIFEADLKQGLNSFRQNLQVEYSQRLLAMVDNDKGGKYDYHAKAAALAEVERIEDWMKKYSRGNGDKPTQATRKYVLYLIETALDRNA